MKVKLTKDQLVGRTWREAGDVVDVDPRRGEQMVRDKAADRAESVEDSDVDSPPDHASRREVERRTGRPPKTGVPELTGEIDPVAPTEPGEVVTKVGSVEAAEVVLDDEGKTAQVSIEEPTSESVRPAGRGGSSKPSGEAKPADEPPKQAQADRGQPLKNDAK